MEIRTLKRVYWSVKRRFPDKTRPSADIFADDRSIDYLSPVVENRAGISDRSAISTVNGLDLSGQIYRGLFLICMI